MLAFVLLYAAYARGGLDRFRQESVAEYLRQLEALRERGIRVGVAPHSVRACPPDWLAEIGRHAERDELVLHVHACEQPREIEFSVSFVAEGMQTQGVFGGTVDGDTMSGNCSFDGAGDGTWSASRVKPQ